VVSLGIRPPTPPRILRLQNGTGTGRGTPIMHGIGCTDVPAASRCGWVLRDGARLHDCNRYESSFDIGRE
jgi:hypothetical protein